METLSAISIAALTLIISIIFLAYAQKEKLGRIYHYLSYLFIAASIAWCSILITYTCFMADSYHHFDGYHHSSSNYHSHNYNEDGCSMCSGMREHKMDMGKKRMQENMREGMMHGDMMHGDSMKMRMNK